MSLYLGDKLIAGSFKSGASWEVGDVGISALGIDEALNKRRYLNGQVISQTQFVQFTAFLKSRVSVYPSLATTEVNWQAAVTNSDLGQCGQFVIDDDAGTIRLPKVVNINGLQDLALMGSIKAESLPNIKGETYIREAHGRFQGFQDYTGCFSAEDSGVMENATGGGDTGGNSPRKLILDASLSSSTYQDNAPVQQEAVQYPYFIQVATGVETSIDVSREIELTNPFTLFQHQWSSFILNNASWLRADTFSWQSGTIYVSAYEQLLTEYNAGTSETAEGITYRLTSTGKKIALADQETAIASLYASTGKAWYYILDTENERFKLPRELPFDGQAKGNGMTLGLTFGGDTDLCLTNMSISSNPSAIKVTTLPSLVGSTQSGTGHTADKTVGVSTDPTKSGIILNRDNTESQMYLYFYVGETIQDANIIAASAALTTISNLTPCHVVVERYINGTSGYDLYDDGMCRQWGRFSNADDSNYTVNFLKEFIDTNYCPLVGQQYGSSGSAQYRTFNIYTLNTKSMVVHNATNGTNTCIWQVYGKVAEGEY